jgi:hypothetical protein
MVVPAGLRPRIAVLGAGVTGASFVDACLARLGGGAAAEVHVFEMGRGAGGRCSTRMGVRHGTPAFAVSSRKDGGDGGDRGDGGEGDEFAQTVRDYEARGLVHRWQDAALGVVDAGVLREQGTAAAAVVPGGGSGDAFALYRVGSNMCEELLQHASTHFGACVHRIARETLDPKQRDSKKRWFLYGSEDEAMGHDAGFDWIVVTSLVSANQERWHATFGGTPPLRDLHDVLRNSTNVNDGSPSELSPGIDLSDVTFADCSLARDVLDGMNETHVRPVLTSINMFDASSVVGQALAADYPFDLTHVNADPVLKKIVKEEIDDGETIAIVAHSTETFAEKVGPLRTSHSSVSKLSAFGPSSQAKQAAVAGEMEYALANVVEQWVPGFAQNLRHADNEDGDLRYKSLHRWGAAFPEPGAYFTDTGTGQLSYVMDSMGLAVCGDFLGPSPTAGKVEAAVMSGRDAADKLAQACRQ